MGTVWLELILKIPVVLVIIAIWWALRRQPDEPPASSDDEDGGIRRGKVHPHPRRPFPRAPRRGPHAGPPVPPPARIRTVRARARTYGH